MSDIPCDRFAAAGDQAAAWKAWTGHLAPIFDAMPTPETEIGGAVSMRSYHFGSVLLGEVSAPAQKLERTARTIGQQGVDHVLIQLYRSGSARTRTARGEVSVEASDFVIYDLSQPIAISATPVSATNILLPRAALGERVGEIAALHGSVFSAAHDPLAELFASYLRDVVSFTDRLAAAHVPAIAETATALCRAALPRARDGGPATESGINLAVRAFIQGRLDRPELGPEMICAQFGMSRATLYRHFAAEDGVQAYIRERRLARAMTLLSRPGDGARPRISSVAYMTGFSDEKTFSRAFKRRFEVLPRDVAGDRTAWLRRSEAASTLGTWIRQLDP